MNRTFIGVLQDSQVGTTTCEVYVEQDGVRHRFSRSVKGVQEGYCWDGAGPQSAELARAILWIVSEVEPPWSLYKGFTSDVIAKLPPVDVPLSNGECWRLSEEDVHAWLRDVRWAPEFSADENYTEGGAHQQARRTWESRVRSAAQLFRRRAAA